MCSLTLQPHRRQRGETSLARDENEFNRVYNGEFRETTRRAFYRRGISRELQIRKIEHDTPFGKKGQKLYARNGGRKDVKKWP